jgi:tetratricopeptide (TPR) repeat protein
MVVSKAFLHIDKTAQSYKNIGMALKWDNMVEEALKQFELGLRVSDNDRDSIQLYSEMGEALIRLAKNAEFESKKPDTDEEPETKESDAPEGKEADNAATEATNGELNGTKPDGTKPDGTVPESNTEKEKPKKTKEQWAQEACDILAKAAALNLTVSKAENEDKEVRRAVMDSWSNRATAELLLGNAEHTVEYIAKAHEAKTKSEYVWCDNIFEVLAEKQEWAKMLDLLRLQDHNDKWIYLYDHHEQVHRAAKAAGQADYVIELYTQSVTQRYLGVTPYLYAQWASFYQKVLGGERMAEAKPLLHKIMETSDSSSLISQASFSLADIFLEEFRATRDPARKEAAFVQMQALVRRIKESMGNEFDPTQSQTTIPLALMTRRLNTLDFQRGLEATFRGCVEALTDEDSWNDSVSFRTLAKVLACVPGLKVDAEIAATCQLYIIDMAKFEKDNITPGSAPASPKPENKELAEDGSETHEKDTAAVNGASDEPAHVNGTTDAAAEDESKCKTETITNGTSVQLTNGDTKADIANGDKKPAEKEEPEKEEPEPKSEEDLDTVNVFLSCNNCKKVVRDWHDGAMYLCYYCTELNLCDKCYEEKLERESGKLPPDWRVLCPAGHHHVKAPVAGWKGLKGGVLKFEDKEVPFQNWLTELKEKKWVEAWDRFWADEMC